MKINKIVELQRDNQRYVERVNKLLEKPKAHSILHCLNVYPEELQYSLPAPVDVDLIYRLIGYVEECERAAKIEALDEVLDYCINHAPGCNPNKMYEYVKGKVNDER